MKTKKIPEPKQTFGYKRRNQVWCEFCGRYYHWQKSSHPDHKIKV